MQGLRIAALVVAALGALLAGGRQDDAAAAESAAGPPVLLALEPTSGPTAGGTVIQVHGIAFVGGTDYRCRVTMSKPRDIIHVVPATVEQTSLVAESNHHFETAANITLEPWLGLEQLDVLTCIAPPHNRSDFVFSSVTRFEVTLNGQQYFSSTRMLFRYHDPPLRVVSIDADVRVVIVGGGFGRKIVCCCDWLGVW